MYDVTKKEIEINVIKDFLNGRILEHWFKFVISEDVNKCGFDLEDIYRKSLVYINLMSNIVEDISTMCPIMNTFDSRQNLSSKEIKYLKDELDELEWDSLSIDIVKELETKGDCFYYIYFDTEVKKHRLKKLKTENMVDIIKEHYNDEGEYVPRHYIYRDRKKVRSLDKANKIIDNFMDDIIVFTEGYCKRFKNVVNFNLSNAEYELILNTPEMGNMIPIIHIKGKEKREDSEFSKIPCVDYIDPILYISTIHTDIRSANRNAGSPRMVVMNGDLDLERSVLDAGGVIHINTPKDIIQLSSRFLPNSEVKYFEITNSLSSMKQELEHHLDSLYRIAGLIPPSLQVRMSTSDSSKAIAQFRTKQETKNKFYMTSIKNSFAEFFALLLKDNSKKNKKRDKVYLQLPKILVTSSVYDELLLTAQEMSLGIITLKDYLKERGYTEEQINSIMKNAREVLENSNLDTSKTNTSINVENEIEENSNMNDNTNGVDNRLKKN